MERMRSLQCCNITLVSSTTLVQPRKQRDTNKDRKIIHNLQGEVLLDEKSRSHSFKEKERKTINIPTKKFCGVW